MEKIEYDKWIVERKKRIKTIESYIEHYKDQIKRWESKPEFAELIEDNKESIECAEKHIKLCEKQIENWQQTIEKNRKEEERKEELSVEELADLELQEAKAEFVRHISGLRKEVDALETNILESNDTYITKRSSRNISMIRNKHLY